MKRALDWSHMGFVTTMLATAGGLAGLLWDQQHEQMNLEIDEDIEPRIHRFYWDEEFHDCVQGKVSQPSLLNFNRQRSAVKS